jgi:hypothetical protein
MSYSFDRVSSDRWSDLSDNYQSMIDELANDELKDDALQSAIIAIDDFDLDEVL